MTRMLSSTLRVFSVFLVLVLAASCGSGTSPETDREALTSLYEATGGPDWTRNTNWLTDAPLNQWEGVITDSEGRVTELHLSRNNLFGVIPTDVGNLDKLKVLHVGNVLRVRNPPSSGDLGAAVIFGLIAGAEVLGSIFGGSPGEPELPPGHNLLAGCIPNRLKDQIDEQRSFLDGLQFCDPENEEANTERLAREFAVQTDNADIIQAPLDGEGDPGCYSEGGSWGPQEDLRAAVHANSVPLTRMLVGAVLEEDHW